MEGIEVKFKGHDVYLFSKVLSKVGMSKFLAGIDDPQALVKDKKRANEAGKEMLALVSENMHLVESEVNTFLENVTGKKNIAELPFDEYEELHGLVFLHKDFPSFFRSAFKLSVRLMVAH